MRVRGKKKNLTGKRSFSNLRSNYNIQSGLFTKVFSTIYGPKKSYNDPLPNMSKTTRNIKEAIDGIGGAFLMLAAISTPFYRYWQNRGATAVEIKTAMPGDELVPHPGGSYTQAITINARVENVWQWVSQTGQDLGGFYSYDFLENLIGCNIHTLDRIVPGFQRHDDSHGLVMHPKAPPIPVHAIEPGKSIVFGGQMDSNTPVSWAFLMQDCGANKTRLISRWLFDFKRTTGMKIAYRGLLLPIASIMQHRMLSGIKKRAEKIA
jgi:hypothetical protein